jgi:hypothetical protein
VPIKCPWSPLYFASLFWTLEPPGCPQQSSGSRGSRRPPSTITVR